MELLLVGGALAAGLGIGALGVAVLWRRGQPAQDAPVEMEVVEDHPATFVPPAPVAREAPPPPPASPRAHPERAPAMVLTHGVQMQDAQFHRGPPPARAPMRAPPAMKSWAQQVREDTPPPVPTEWARRQVGPVEPGRVAGVCSGCNARLSVSDARPLRIVCPVCGRQKLVA